MNQRKMKRDHQDSCVGYGAGNNSGSSSSSSTTTTTTNTIGATTTVKGECPAFSTGKSKMWAEDEQEATGMDELLAVLGYKVRSSDMAEVAQKLEQLEMVLGSAQEDGISHLSDTVHYNPSDLTGWVQSMLSELNPQIDDNTILSNSQIPHTNDNQSRVVFHDYSEYDLRAIPGVAAFPPPPPIDEEQNAPKRLKTETTTTTTTTASIEPSSSPLKTEGSESTRAVVLVDSQEAGVRLVHTLMACAKAVQQDNLKLADTLVKHVGLMAASQAGAMRKVATYFAEALARRIYGIYHQELMDSSYADMLQMHFYEACPYLKFAHFTANQAILEAFATSNRVHVIDFGLKQGFQWPALMQALALRPGGPPAFRLTGIGPPPSDNTDALQQVGWKLAQLAETIGVEFEFRGFVANSLADLEPSILDLRPLEMETVAVNSVFELHPLLARPGAIEKVLSSIKAMRPKIVTIVEQEANHNGPVFLDRFTEALHYYSTMFDSLEISPPSQDLIMSEVYLRKQICNVVACEGADRVERHENLDRWRDRFGSAGFDRVHLGSNAFKQASMLLALFAGGEGYRVEENDGCLMLGWHTRPLIATSAWQLADAR